MPDPAFSLKGRRVWVAGHRGMVGAALVRRLAGEGCHILTVDRTGLDLCRQADVEDWLARHRPEAIFLAAATVGGIHANDSRPADFIYDNLLIEANIIHSAWTQGVEKLLFLGSSCIYPREAAQPMAEDCLLSGPLEPTNQWYAIAKIAGLKMCQAYYRQYGCNFISCMPTNLYGPGDNYDLRQSHVIPALILKAHLAQAENAETMEVWGSGRPKREFLYVDDMADACVFLMHHYSEEEPVNIGSGREETIADLAHIVAETVGFSGDIRFDPQMPDGTPRKLVDSSRINTLGWQASTHLPDGLALAYRWFLEHRAAMITNEN